MKADVFRSVDDARLALQQQTGVEPSVYERFGRWFLKALAENPNTAGGFMVPSSFGPMLASTLEKYGVARRYGRVVKMLRDLQPCSRRIGAATVYLTSEGQAITESAQSWGSIELSAKRLGCLTKVSSELETDAEGLGRDLADEFGRAMAQAEDSAVFNGDGTSTYYGFSGICPALQSGAYFGGMDAASGHDTFLEIDITDLSNLVARLPKRAHANARWYVSHVGFGQVFSRLASNGLLSVNGEPWMLGFPITLTPSLPTATTDISDQVMLLLGDLEQAIVIGDRREFTFERSALGSTFNTDQTQFKGTERVDIVTSHDLGTSTAAGSVVGLIAE